MSETHDERQAIPGGAASPPPPELDEDGDIIHPSPLPKIRTPKGRRRPKLEDVTPILERVARGASLVSVCDEAGIHDGHMFDFLHDDEELRERYARAQTQRGLYWQERALELSFAAATGRMFDGTKVDPAGARVALDAIKWAVGRMSPNDGPKIKLELYEGMSDEELLRKAEDLRLQREQAAQST